MEEPTASELLAQAHEEQELKEAANRRGDSKAALAHAKARRRALDAACHTAAGREAQRLLRSGGAKAPVGSAVVAPNSPFAPPAGPAGAVA